MNFDTLRDILLSLIFSYIIIKIFNKHPLNNLDKPYDYFQYYIINNAEDFLKTILITPLLFIFIKFTSKIVFDYDKIGYNIEIINKIIQELYFNIASIVKGNRIK
jgi:hypothetical protein